MRLEKYGRRSVRACVISERRVKPGCNALQGAIAACYARLYDLPFAVDNYPLVTAYGDLRGLAFSYLNWTDTGRLRSKRAVSFSSDLATIKTGVVASPALSPGLAALPSDTVIDGEVVALDDSGRPSFNTLQNYAAGHPIFYYALDLLILKGRDLRSKPLRERRELLRSEVLSKLDEPIRYSPESI